MKTKKDLTLKIITMVCEKLIVMPEQVLGKNRSRPFVRARQMISSLLKESLGCTLYEIRDAIGYNNHTSALHALKMHESDYSINFIYRKEYKELLEVFNIDDFELNLEEEYLIKQNIELKTKLDVVKLELKDTIKELKELKIRLQDIKDSIFYNKKQFAID